MQKVVGRSISCWGRVVCSKREIYGKENLQLQLVPNNSSEITEAKCLFLFLIHLKFTGQRKDTCIHTDVKIIVIFS